MRRVPLFLLGGGSCCEESSPPSHHPFHCLRTVCTSPLLIFPHIMRESGGPVSLSVNTCQHPFHCPTGEKVVIFPFTVLRGLGLKDRETGYFLIDLCSVLFPVVIPGLVQTPTQGRLNLLFSTVISVCLGS